MKKIILTGGGTAGHVTPNLALLPKLKNDGFEVVYIGSYNGMEKELVKDSKIPYHGISAGKLRRYVDVKNITDAFRVVKGLADAISIIKKEKPNIVFSKGGFVTVPVVIAAKICGVPVVLHESDITPGLANKIAIPFATAICTSFPETVSQLPKKKAFATGSPLREELFYGNEEKGKELCGFRDNKPVVLIIGGSSGSAVINSCVRTALPELLKSYNVVHLCGRGNVDASIQMSGYIQFEFLSKELSHIFAATDLVVSRAGSNAIFEFLALKKPSILIPLSKKASRGDQILNAQSFTAQGFCEVIQEEDLTPEKLLKELANLFVNRDKYIVKMKNSKLSNGVDEVCKVLNDYCKG